MNKDVQIIIRRALTDVKVELSDEFDKNFERQAFFSEAWERRKSPTRAGGATLVGTGRLRRSIKSIVADNSVAFSTTEPYAAIHNEGGEITVTSKMKGLFWHKYMNAAGALVFCRKKNGEMRKDKSTLRISSEAEFWKYMALKKVGSKIRIPKRRFLGTSPELMASVKKIIDDNIARYLNNDFKLKEK